MKIHQFESGFSGTIPENNPVKNGDWKRSWKISNIDYSKIRRKFYFQLVMTVTVVILLFLSGRLFAQIKGEPLELIPERSLEKTREFLDLKMSDILLSSRWCHPSGKNNPQNTENAIADFFATRSYGMELLFRQRLH